MESLLHQIVQEEQQKMMSLGFVETWIPSPESPSRCNIFMSANWHICRRLLVLINSGNGIQPGIWSRSLVLESPELPHQYRTGSMYVSLFHCFIISFHFIGFPMFIQHFLKDME